MTTYLPFYSKGTGGSPTLFRDPYCALYLPLWKDLNTTFTSEDIYGRSCTKSGTTFTSGATYFDGQDDCISIGYFSWPAGFTAFIWAKYTGVGVGSMLFGSAKIFLYAAASNAWKVKAAVDGSSGGNPEWGPMSNNEWYSIAWTSTLTTCYLYINGDRVASWSENQAVVSEPYYVGKFPSTPYWNKGYIGDFAFFNRPLSAPEISSLHIATHGRYL